MSRNLLEYPITGPEVLSQLERTYIETQRPPVAIGGNEGYIMYNVMRYFALNKDRLGELVDSMRIENAPTIRSNKG
jgi:hypothetical protein